MNRVENDIKVSIIIPAYNVEKYIERCIKSASKQTLAEIEIIVINDGSTDRTKEIIESLAQQDKRMVVINQVNGGLSSARNAGLDIAKGEFIQHLDGDDWIEELACQELYAFAKLKNLDVVICDFFSNDDKGKVDYITEWSQAQGEYLAVDALHAFLAVKFQPCIWAKFFRACLYREIRLPLHILFGEDLATTPKLLLKAQLVGKYNKAFVHYTYNPKSITKNHVYKKNSELFAVFKSIRLFLKENDYKETFQQELLDLEFYYVTGLLLAPPHWDCIEYKKKIQELCNYISKTNHINFLVNYHIYNKIMLKIIMRFPYPFLIRFFQIQHIIKSKLRRFNNK
jgi:glycosyltransferase involved in cell wall biosynthesis